MGKEVGELVNNASVGFIGLFVTLSDINVLISIFVGLATGIYLCTKIFFLIKNKGRYNG